MITYRNLSMTIEIIICECKYYLKITFNIIIIYKKENLILSFKR